MRHRRRATTSALVAAALAALAAVDRDQRSGRRGGCGRRQRRHAGKDTKAVGFIFVGPKDDFGYNQAAYEGARRSRRRTPTLEILTAENVPENDDADARHGGHDRQGRQDHLRHQLRPPRPGR